MPIWQMYGIHDSADNDKSCEGSGCIFCNCCGICCNLATGRNRFVRNENAGCRYIPFSMYNLAFMIMHPGKQLNDKLSNNIAHSGFGTFYLLMLTLITKGVLNLYMFINACAKVFYNAAGGTKLSASTALAFVSMLSAMIDLKVYAFTFVFGLILLPYTAATSFLFCCPDCCSLVETQRGKNGTWLFKILMKFWSYVDKY